MMQDWFKEQDVNTAPLPSGHRERFLERLEARDKKETAPVAGGGKILPMRWQWWAAAACVLVMLGTGLFVTSRTETTIAQLSPEMAASQDVFNKIIENELVKLEQHQSPETERIIADTKKNLAKLEDDYSAITKDFKTNSNSAVMESMLLNLKTRVALLEVALQQINKLKTIKEQQHAITL